MGKEWKIIGLYFTEDEEIKQEFRDIMLNKYLDDTQDDVHEALAMLHFRLTIAEKQESFEECAIIKDILEQFEYIPYE